MKKETRKNELQKLFSWNKIQKDHDNGMFINKICEEYNISRRIINTAEKYGLFVKRNHIRKWSSDEKLKISKNRKKWLKENPEKHPWKKNKKFISKPCEHFKKQLKTNGVLFIEEFQPLHNRGFSIDIAFPDKKFGIEINGEQHYTRSGDLKPYYNDRKKLIEDEGWELIDLHYTLAWNDDILKDIILKSQNKSQKIKFDYISYVKKKMESKNKKPKKKKKIRVKKPKKTYEDKLNIDLIKNELQQNKHLKTICQENGYEYYKTYNLLRKKEILKLKLKTPKLKKYCPICGKKIYKKSKECITCFNKRKRNPNKTVKTTNPKKIILIDPDILSKEVWKHPITSLSKKYKMSDTGIRKRCKKHNIETPPMGYWQRIDAGMSHEDALNPPEKIVDPKFIKKPLTKEQVSEIKKLIYKGELSLRKIGEKFDRSHVVIMNIRDGNSHLKFNYL